MTIYESYQVTEAYRMPRNIPVTIVLVLVLSAQFAYGQRPGSQYVPARPTTSPYLNLLRRDTGVVPNYHALVRPQQQQRAINQQQQQRIQRQDQAIRQLDRGLLQVRQAETRATGVRGGYMNYSHFFPNSASK